jgi:hypothetical protein
VGNINCDASGFGLTTILMRNNTILIEKKQLKDIANWMKVEHSAELSEVLQGIFFMDGNVLPDDCLTMYCSDWNADQLTLLLHVFDPVIWTFHSSMAGRMLVYLAKSSRFTYLFRFRMQLCSMDTSRR